MASKSIFLKFEGPNLAGESVVDKHKDEIDIDSFSWGMTNSGSMHVGTGGGIGAVSVGDVSFTMTTNKASPLLMQYCCSGQHFDKVTLSVNEAGGEATVEYLKFVMENVLISHFSSSHHEGSLKPNESFSLNFAKYKVDYTPQTEKGGAGAPVHGGWDIAKGTKQ